MKKTIIILFAIMMAVSFSCTRNETTEKKKKLTTKERKLSIVEQNLRKNYPFWDETRKKFVDPVNNQIITFELVRSSHDSLTGITIFFRPADRSWGKAYIDYNCDLKIDNIIGSQRMHGNSFRQIVYSPEQIVESHKDLERTIALLESIRRERIAGHDWASRKKETIEDRLDENYPFWKLEYSFLDDSYYLKFDLLMENETIIGCTIARKSVNRETVEMYYDYDCDAKIEEVAIIGHDDYGQKTKDEFLIETDPGIIADCQKMKFEPALATLEDDWKKNKAKSSN